MTKRSRNNKAYKINHNKRKTTRVRFTDVAPLENMPIKSIVRNTPRSQYAREYFKDVPIHLSNQGPVLPQRTGGTPEVLFQVSYSSPDQFSHYANLHKDPEIDCFYQSLFSLGLRGATLAKKDSSEINKKGESGVPLHEILHYIAFAFNIPMDQVVFERLPELSVKPGVYKNNVSQARIKEFFKGYLENKYATIFVIEFSRKGKFYYSHAMVAYKWNNVVYYFDPQKKGLLADKDVLATSLSHIIRYSKNSTITDFGYFKVPVTENPKELVDKTCPIAYVG
jgi:hypothetical protein